ncbi:hypothetical protein MOV08_02915 [Streptomyces yunnanensis]|uniref:Luciferase-like monooxygenase n=1 Tax=Streptomyces yunnanensis TaxID=156453 RepID=A0ABY8A0Q9_9ACTN|nr:hypothetical protein [Streptomyces yunnanensis]WEB38358.1 hypothetical protein MOV08_02915 [Streptomyces yunnanensis]
MAGRQRLRAADTPSLEPAAGIRPLADRYRDTATAAGHESGEHPDNGRKLAGIGPEHIRDSKGAIVGSPATVPAPILRLVRDFGGVDQIPWQVGIGAMPLAQARRSIDLFRDAVVPLRWEKVAALRAGVRRQAAVSD